MKYEYTVVYSKRRSLSITVSADNKVTLRCPIGYSRERAERFLNEKSGWIEKVVLKNEKKLSANADVINYKCVFVQGEKYPLYTNSGKSAITDSGVFIRNLKDVKRLYINAFAVDFFRRVEEISRNTGLRYNGLQIKSYKSRWGCCDGGNNLCFNYKLFMLPDYIQYYIIIHELCHTSRHDHSKSFWRLVERFVPDFRRVKKDLRGYDFLTTLY